ncbi:hypothetical protein CAEBREN_08704 [Caenorhabditis brenneri]|uniref:Uncharacterized protein n=1 Tax=Caenorhabditis brenneri TaxID=135651 RepID=G0MBE4_CAEBE|nr:hypothetical protein CAEBREN_08704 [Caenorhabditis brenneri]
MVDSPGVFKAPLPITESVVTQHELNTVSKKHKTLVQMLKKENPPDLLPYSMFLLNSMDKFGTLVNLPYNQRRREVVNVGLKCQEVLEDVVIRRLMSGEDVNQSLDRWRLTDPIVVGTLFFLIWTPFPIAG